MSVCSYKKSTDLFVTKILKSSGFSVEYIEQLRYTVILVAELTFN